MQIELHSLDREFRYTLRPDPDDPSEAKPGFADNPTPFRLVRREYRIVLPKTFRTIHPDAHAAAIWHALSPIVGSRLLLPFCVSKEFARTMLDRHNIRLGPVGRRQSPRRPPERVVPALLFSGGMDSMAASIVLPRRCHHLFLDRIPHPESAHGGDLIDLVRQRDACDSVRRAGRRVHRTADDHEHLFDPYPMWHSDMAILPALYMADSLGLSAVDLGEVLDSMRFGGYYAGEVSSWRMRSSASPPPGKRQARAGLFESVGLRRATCIGGLSEVATAAIVARSPHRGKSFSCYYASEESFCMQCDKCFKKLLLRHIAEGEEVPEGLFERFLCVPRLAGIFRPPYFNWHHVWYYLFQKIQCRHWFARELQRQARQGPDLSALEKWYPKARADMEPDYAEEVVEAITKRVGTMSAREMKALETVDVPALHAPALPERPAAKPAVRRFDIPATPTEIRTLRELLAKRLLVAGAPRWAGCGVADVFLREPEASVWLRLDQDSGPPLLARLFRLSGPQDQYAARLGPLGLTFATGDEVPGEIVEGLRRALAAALSQASQEVSGRAPGARRAL